MREGAEEAIGAGALQNVTTNENLENVWQLKDLQTRFLDVWQLKELRARFSDVWQ